jgi:hypothetical protein
MSFYPKVKATQAKFNKLLDIARSLEACYQQHEAGIDEDHMLMENIDGLRDEASVAIGKRECALIAKSIEADVDEAD